MPFNIFVELDPSGAVRGTRRINRALGTVGTAADQLQRRLSSAVGILAIGATLSRAIRGAAQFETAIAEISTIADQASFNIGTLTSAINEQSIAFGSAGIVQARAAYDIISAGAANTTAAINTLTAANRLATAGITDVSTAADGLTSVLNAYGLSARQAEDVSDTLFVTVRGGKTTIDELSSSIGIVAPLAASAGVSFQEVSAGIAALTASGINTRRAVTGLRAVISSIIAPSAEATSLAEQLGVEFNAQGLAAQGLTTILNSVADATGGNIELMQMFFPQVEALTPALALAANEGQRVADVLALMETRAGATDAAFEIAADTFSQQLASTTQSVAVFSRNLVEPFLGPLGAGLERITAIFDRLARNIDSVLVVLGALAFSSLAGPIARGFRALTTRASDFRNVLSSTIDEAREGQEKPLTSYTQAQNEGGFLNLWVSETPGPDKLVQEGNLSQQQNQGIGRSQ